MSKACGFGKGAIGDDATCLRTPVPDWWDDDLDALVKQTVALFGEDATDDTVVRVAEHYCRDIDVDDSGKLSRLPEL
jgi:hypothetical protein